ncbi:MAG: YggS family pyridoxal phosphate-dependent enzyme [Bacteroidetes bacterium]|nr:YggS family pyridoxal phosphate-dependent enzyme [Bacteroidota bacterium]
MEAIPGNLKEIQSVIAGKAKLIAISKTKSKEEILKVYSTGFRAFGENKVQELVAKWKDLPKDIEWHMVGHLQTNKVKYIAPFVSKIHSVDSLRLLRTINKEGKKNKRVIPCLFQMHIALEESKFGLSMEELLELLSSEDFGNLKNIRMDGVMGMATLINDEQTIIKEFKHLKQIFDQIKQKYFNSSPGFIDISMGMSHDYKIALDEGSTIVRIGNAIFGARKN